MDTFKRFIGRPRHIAQPITISGFGFSFVAGNGLTAQVQWSQVIESRPLKRDRFSWDEVRFSFRLSSADPVGLSEDQPGVDLAKSDAEIRFPSLIGWRDRIIRPAFACNQTIFYFK